MNRLNLHVGSSGGGRSSGSARRSSVDPNPKKEQILQQLKQMKLKNSMQTNQPISVTDYASRLSKSNAAAAGGL